MISPTARSIHAQAQLGEILSTMSARLLNAVSVTVELPRRDRGPDEIAADRHLATLLRAFLEDIVRAGPREDCPALVHGEQPHLAHFAGPLLTPHNSLRC